MSSKHHGDGPQPAYKRGGFGSVWRWAVAGHGRKRWLKVLNWAKRHVKMAKPKDREGYRKEIAAAEKKLAWFRHHDDPKTHADGRRVVVFDGKPCAHWIAKILADARASGIWNGVMLSGVRTSAESIALCEHMCGAPACPGTCGGVNSNHNCDVCSYPKGACDVTDPFGLEAFCRSHHRGLIGDGRVLPNDVNHFSHAGN